MDFTLDALTMLALPLLLIGQWWWLQRRSRVRLHAVQASHARYKARAEVLIALTKQQISSLRQQVLGRPHPDRAAIDRLMDPCHDGAEVIVLEDESLRRHFPATVRAGSA